MELSFDNYFIGTVVLYTMITLRFFSDAGGWFLNFDSYPILVICVCLVVSLLALLSIFELGTSSIKVNGASKFTGHLFLRFLGRWRNENTIRIEFNRHDRASSTVSIPLNGIILEPNAHGIDTGAFPTIGKSVVGDRVHMIYFRTSHPLQDSDCSITFENDILLLTPPKIPDLQDTPEMSLRVVNIEAEISGDLVTQIFRKSDLESDVVRQMNIIEGDFLFIKNFGFYHVGRIHVDLASGGLLERMASLSEALTFLSM